MRFHDGASITGWREKTEMEKGVLQKTTKGTKVGRGMGI
jgi:hypothetical protein